MPTAIFIAGIAIGLFTLAFLTKRAFGVLGLALAAGALISANFATIVTTVLQAQGVQVGFMPLSVLVEVILVITPAFLLLISGPSYGTTWQRILGSAAFAILAVIFLLQPLGQALQLSGASLQMYQWVGLNQSVIIVVGLIFAVVDTLFVKNSSKHSKKH